MRRIVAAIVLVLVSVAAIGFAPAAAAGDQLDQLFSASSLHGPIYDEGGPGYDWAQSESYTAGISGTLDKLSVELDLPYGGPAGSLNVALYATDSQGLPTGSALASTAISPSLTGPCQWVDVTGFSVPQVAGTSYAIVISTTSVAVYDGWCGGSGWSGGVGATSFDGGATWSSPQGYDYSFMTYVIPQVVDTTPPVITPTVNGTLGSNGWYTSDVSVSWSVVDNESAVSSESGCDATTINTDTTGTTLTCTATSGGGSDSQSVTIMRDATDPVVNVTGVSNGATYTLGSVPTAGCSTSDATSGVATDATLGSAGGPVGSITATCSGATDNAGNPGSATATYSVDYAWNGFFAPVANAGVLNLAKAGSAIPIKFSLSGNQGLNILAAGSPTVSTVACDAGDPTQAVTTTTTAGASALQYDPTTDTYTYVWKTNKAWAGTCQQLQVQLIDGSTHIATFKFS